MFGRKSYQCDHVSTIQWVDRETLKYTHKGYSALIWVDHEPGFFNRGRIIKKSSIMNWNTVPSGALEAIDANSVYQIIECIKQYYKHINKSCRVEE